VDGTLGAGGHAFGILEASQPNGRLLGLEIDLQALHLAQDRLAQFGGRVHIVQASYASLRTQLNALGWEKVDGILLDLGLSSMQVDTPERGFSFQADGPLDMRFDRRNPVRAADFVNQMSEDELANLLYRYGEERRSRNLARAIVRSRPIYTTKQLAQVVAAATPGSRPGGSQGIHPATRTFQALRIAVNQELETLEAGLPTLADALVPQGRLAVIAFHSLEDRIVKGYFRQESRDCICPPRQPVCTCGHRAIVKEITRRPIRPGEAEVRSNPRARSARLRVVEKL
jgi:16S rRNA (cytosine1402-N4)-methyltransferase